MCRRRKKRNSFTISHHQANVQSLPRKQDLSRCNRCLERQMPLCTNNLPSSSFHWAFIAWHPVVWNIHLDQLSCLCPVPTSCAGGGREKTMTLHRPCSAVAKTPMCCEYWCIAPNAKHSTVWAALEEVNFIVSSQSHLVQILNFKGKWKEEDNSWELLLRTSWKQVVEDFIQNSGGDVWDQARYFSVGNPKREAEMAELQNTVQREKSRRGGGLKQWLMSGKE